MADLRGYSVVHVRQLLHPSEHYDGWRVNKRHPQVGDEGTIVNILHAPGLSDRYVVESSGQDGVTVWLGDFSSEELMAADELPNHAMHWTPR